MIYFASPYTHQDKKVEVQRFVSIRAVTAKACAAGYPVYSPIVHCHELALAHELPTDWVFWKRYNTSFVRKASEVWILTLEGWELSKGVKYEMELAHDLFIPCRLISPDADFVGTEFL